MIEEDVTQGAPLTDEVANPNLKKDYIEQTEDIQPKKTNPKKIIGLIFAGCILLLLCCCCGYIFFLPQNYSEQTVDDLCSILESEGQKAPFGICEEEFIDKLKENQSEDSE